MSDTVWDVFLSAVIAVVFLGVGAIAAVFYAHYLVWLWGVL